MSRPLPYVSPPPFGLGPLTFTAFDLCVALAYTIPLAALFYCLGRTRRAHGLYLALSFTLYGPVRFLLDALRAGDVRYGGWTPGQFGAVLATLAGLWMLRAVMRARNA